MKCQNETVTSLQGYLMKTILSELEEMHSTYMRSKIMDNIFISSKKIINFKELER
ncbi:hypothetical protein SKL01_19050 [Staphylococcus kloosii]|uniref:Transcriptional regulator n=1 Tax=Staphylococcus kloosii TaxID=29384 RepID=A0ABQ0XMR7_9STAP|nr:hypothetical protein SKL01_19050 [Staphylococcus kloosii]